MQGLEPQHLGLFSQPAVIFGTGTEVSPSYGHLVGHDSSRWGIDLVAVGLMMMHCFQVMGTGHHPMIWQDPEVAQADMGHAMLPLAGVNCQVPAIIDCPLGLPQEGWKHGGPWDSRMLHQHRIILDIVQCLYMFIG